MDYLPGQYISNSSMSITPHFRLDNIRYTGGSWVNEEVLVRICDDGGDRYRFGFNGQEKVNEIAGMGNHNTAEFWEYDTRLGRRWNVDPVDQISISNYAVFRNSPLVYTDVDGDCVDCDENYPDAEVGDIVSPEASRLDWQKADNGEWLALGGEFNKVNIVVDGKGGDFQLQIGGNYDWGNAKTTLDYTGGVFGALNTAVRPGNQWLGKNGKYYSNSWGGNQYTGGRSGAFKAAGFYKWAGRGVVGVTAVIGGIETYNGYQMDGGHFGYNANSAVAGAAGGIIGGWAGAEVGAAIGAGFGALFGGVGAVPGAVIGGFIGGWIGGNVGVNAGQGSVNWYYRR